MPTLNESFLSLGIFGCVTVIFNLIFIGIILATQRKVNAIKNWPSTLGTVLMSDIEWRRSSKGGSTAYPVVQYTYAVNGQTYQSRKRAPGGEVGGTGAKKVVAKYPAGAQVVVFYDPQKPSEAVIERKAPAQWVMVLVLVIFDLTFCGALGVMTFFSAFQ
jgi:hypothetical protein